MKKVTKAFFTTLATFLLMPAVVNAAPASQNNQTTSSQSSSATTNNNANQENGDATFAYSFENTNTTLSGKSVKATMYFNKVDYWNVKKATFNLDYMISQLSNDQTSNITLELNGVKFYSFKPGNNGNQQNMTVDLPTNLLQNSNTLTVEGQIINKDQNQELPATPANWLTIYDGSNVNFSYSINQPNDQISSFYSHFTGEDTVKNDQSVILVPQNPSNAELTAATYALAGASRVVSGDNSKIELNSLKNKHYASQPYQIVIAKYGDLPNEYKKQINASEVNNENAYMRFFNGDKKKVLVVTAKDDDALIKAGQYIANQELMQQTTTNSKTITESTQTFSSINQDNGNFPLMSNSTKMTGEGHQEQVFFVNLPHDQTNSKGSYINLNFRYSDNLDFKTSLVTVYVNGKPIGSQSLSSAKADGDHLKVKIPNNTDLNNNCTVKVAFDLNMKNNDSNSQTPWAYIESSSNAYIDSAEKTDLLFSNYPSCFISDKSFNNIAVQIPKKMNDDYFKALTNVFSLIGNYAESNVGSITFYKKEMSDSEMKNHNLIVIGSPQDTPLIKKLNSHLFFKFNKNFTRFVSNEKLSIESGYGKQIGAVQLLFNPYNKNNAALVVSGASSKDVQIASSQIDTQAHASTLKGDAAVIDDNGQQYTYRFKKKVNNEQKISITKRIKANPMFMAYVIMGILLIAVVIAIIILFVRKNFNGKERR